MSIRLLSPPHNYAICKMDERAFPGVVVQGDSLYALFMLLKDTRAFLAKEGSDPDLDDAAAEIVGGLDYEIQKFAGVLKHYEAACAAEGYGLPYVKFDK